HRRRGHADASDWMARASGSSRGETKAALATITEVAERPETQEALLVGEVSLAQAGEIASAPAECEAELLALARSSGLRPVRDAAPTSWCSRTSTRCGAATPTPARSARSWAAGPSRYGWPASSPPTRS